MKRRSKAGARAAALATRAPIHLALLPLDQVKELKREASGGAALTLLGRVLTSLSRLMISKAALWRCIADHPQTTAACSLLLRALWNQPLGAQLLLACGGQFKQHPHPPIFSSAALPGNW